MIPSQTGSTTEYWLSKKNRIGGLPELHRSNATLLVCMSPRSLEEGYVQKDYRDSKLRLSTNCREKVKAQKTVYCYLATRRRYKIFV